MFNLHACVLFSKTKYDKHAFMDKKNPVTNVTGFSVI
jgi:hypothetical protein